MPATTAVSSSLPQNQALLLSALSRASASQHPPFPAFPLCPYYQSAYACLMLIVCMYAVYSMHINRIHLALKDELDFVLVNRFVYGNTIPIT